MHSWAFAGLTRGQRCTVRLLQALVAASLVVYGVSIVVRGTGHPSVLLDGG